ncbi:MAG: hypothetical protein HC865_25700 [Cyanobacteria bacterium RU_5_0]|nr:hypothetical protein [Cyanobacteria bacterium RU_5_0]
MFDFGNNASTSALDRANVWTNAGSSLQAQTENAGALQTESFSGLQGRSSSLAPSATSLPTNHNGAIEQENLLGALNNTSRSFTNIVARTDPRDFFTFRVDSPQKFNATLSGLSADADLFLIRDFNNNGFWDNGRTAGVEDETIRLSTRSGIASETISADTLIPGTYHLVVQYPLLSGSTLYNLHLNTTPAD